MLLHSFLPNSTCRDARAPLLKLISIIVVHTRQPPKHGPAVATNRPNVSTSLSSCTADKRDHLISEFD